MTNIREENKKHNSTIKDETEKHLDQQKQQIDNITSDVSHATNKFNENINEYQKTSNEIIEKSIDTTSKYQQNAINTFQSITNNFVELQKNLLETYQSVISRFLDVTSKSYRNNPTSPQRYADIYNKANQTITDNTVNATRRLNEFVLGSTETFNKSIEIAQKYYNDSIQNYFNFLKKIEKSSSNQWILYFVLEFLKYNFIRLFNPSIDALTIGIARSASTVAFAMNVR